ncbi:MAG: PaaI family thioesterase [Kofleriaceae bacterium]
MSLVDMIAAAKASGDWNAMCDVVPYSKFLGISALREGDNLITKMTYKANQIGNTGLPAIHGGAIGSLLESAAIFELLYRSETVVLPKTITLTIDYLRSAGPVDTFAHATITRHGKRVANVHVEAYQTDRAHPVATAIAHFLVMRDS